jgi:hypothetical protein
VGPGPPTTIPFRPHSDTTSFFLLISSSPAWNAPGERQKIGPPFWRARPL